LRDPVFVTVTETSGDGSPSDTDAPEYYHVV
jgi:hypothetical protein